MTAIGNSEKISSFQQHRELRLGERHGASRGLQPRESPALQTLGEQVQSVTVPPENFVQIAALAAKHEHLTEKRILLQRRLHIPASPTIPAACPSRPPQSRSASLPPVRSSVQTLNRGAQNGHIYGPSNAQSSFRELDLYRSRSPSAIPSPSAALTDRSSATLTGSSFVVVLSPAASQCSAVSPTVDVAVFFLRCPPHLHPRPPSPLLAKSLSCICS